MADIAVLLATYNGEKYLAAQLDSLLNQTCGNFKCYIHDDGSSDGTMSVAREYGKNYPDRFSVLEYEYEAEHGPKNNFFSLLERVEADYYMFCDQDDVWLPQKIEREYSAVRDTEDEMGGGVAPCLVFSDLCVTDSELNVIAPSFLAYSHKDPSRISFSELLAGNVGAGCTMILNRALRDIAVKSGYDYKKVNYMHDWHLMILAATFGKISYLDERLILYRQHGTNQVGAKDAGFWKWISRTFGNFLTGKAFEMTKRRFSYQRAMAKELLKFPDMRSGDREIVEALASVENKNKIARIKIYRKYRLIESKARYIWKYLVV